MNLDFDTVAQLAGLVLAAYIGYHYGWRRRQRCDVQAIRDARYHLNDASLSTEARHVANSTIDYVEKFIP